MRGISDREVTGMANDLGRRVLTRDLDFTVQRLLRYAEYESPYLMHQLKREEIEEISERLRPLSGQGF